MTRVGDMKLVPLCKELGKKNISLCEQWFDLHKLFERFSCRFGNIAKSHGKLLEVVLAEHIPRFYMGDPLRINDLLKNLFTYAHNHIDDGILFFSVDAVPVLQDDYRVVINVTTSNGGISFFERDTIFQPVTQTGKQGHNSLYIAKTLAELMGGDVTIESTLGWGTKYCVQLVLRAEKIASDDFYDFENVRIDTAANLQQTNTY